MSSFTEDELEYLKSQRLGRLATSVEGRPHVVPVSFRYNREHDTIDIGGRDLVRTRKFRNVQANPNAALVIDDMVPPWQPRAVMVRGRAEALEDAAGPDGQQLGPVIRIHRSQVISCGLDSGAR